VTRATTEFHGCPASGGGIERLFFSAANLNIMLLSRKKLGTRPWPENTLKEEINTKLPTCDDKGVFTDDNDRGKGKGVFRKHK
jgi:hypothetical protein